MKTYSKLHLSLILLCAMALGGCTQSKEDDPEDGDKFYSLWKSEYRLEVSPNGETVNVEVQISKPFVYGTTHELPMYDYLLTCPAFVEGHNLEYEYKPENFTYHSDDIVNLVPSADGDRFLLPTEEMLEAGVTILNEATDFDYKWIHVSVAEDAVTITAKPNDTGEYRHIILLFLLDSEDVFYRNNVIEIMQPAKAAG